MGTGKGEGDVKVTRNTRSFLPAAATTGALALLGAGLAWIAYSRRNVLHDIPMTAALNGELRTFDDVTGQVAYYVAGPVTRGLPPLVFIHSVNAAASSAEMRPLYLHYARHRRVYAVDLPGFGFSNRPDIAYSPKLYRDVLNHFISLELGGGPVDAVALAVSCEFLALAAQSRPNYYRSLTFLSPTGMTASWAGIRGSDLALRFLRVLFWSRPLFDLLTSRPALRFFLGQSQRKGFDRELAYHAYVASHQPGAEHAPFYFLAGKLFTPAILSTYAAVTKPVLMIRGRGPVVAYDRMSELQDRANWSMHEFADCAELVHYDDPKGVIARMDQLFARL